MKQIFLFAIATLLVLSVRAQNNVGINTTSPNASAALDVTSTTQGMLVPRMATTQRNAISSPANGLLVYDNTLNGFYYYNGTAWSQLGGSSSSSSAALNINALISSGNLSGNGTYYPNGTTGANATEVDTHHMLTANATKVTFNVVASGPLTSSYTFSLRRGTYSGGALSFSDLGPEVILTGSTTQTITLTGLNLQAGETLGIKMTGTATIATNARSIFYSLTAQ